MGAPLIAVRDTTAAKMLDLPATEFRRLVQCGALPPAVRIAGHERWRVRDIEAILSGDAAKPKSEDIEV